MTELPNDADVAEFDQKIDKLKSLGIASAALLLLLAIILDTIALGEREFVALIPSLYLVGVSVVIFLMHSSKPSVADTSTGSEVLQPRGIWIAAHLLSAVMAFACLWLALGAFGVENSAFRVPPSLSGAPQGIALVALCMASLSVKVLMDTGLIRRPRIIWTHGGTLIVQSGLHSESLKFCDIKSITLELSRNAILVSANTNSAFRKRNWKSSPTPVDQITIYTLRHGVTAEIFTTMSARRPS